ncbi:MAG: thioredoxin [Luteitalea sp.]|nr:thioredoxin [Luteitalea sp.]
MAAYEFDDRGIIVRCPGCGQRNRLLFERLGSTVRCGSCRNDLSAPSTPLEIRTSEEFDHLIAASAVPVVVDYWAPWCGPCRVVAPELEKVAARAGGRFVVAKVNTDALSDIGERFAIRSIPTLAIFEGGREVTRTTGARPAADIEELVRTATRPH